MNTSKADLEAKLEQYAQIKMIFGKFKGKSIGELHNTNPEYLKWLLKSYKVDERTSPTMRAILRYVKECV